MDKIHFFWGVWGLLLITAHFCTQPLDIVRQAATMLHLFLSIYLSSKISLALCLLQISSGILFASEQCLTSAAFQTPRPRPLLCCSPSAIAPTSPRPLCHLLQTLSLFTPSRPLPITCTHAFCICSITSAQYFSFPPLSFIFLLPVLLLPLPPLPLPCVFSCLGHSRHLKKASASPGLCIVLCLVHCSLCKPLNEHNYGCCGQANKSPF